jgi:hypothetical protein
MADMVEKNLVGDGELAICLGHPSTYVRCAMRAIPPGPTVQALACQNDATPGRWHNLCYDLQT